MGMDAWHSQGFRGAGIKVGVIDPQMGRWDQLLGSELPPANRVSFQSFSGSPPDDDSVHGTACAEIVTDLAPDMDHLYLALTGTEVGIANAINWMQGNGVKVITMSAGWLSWGPGDGSGPLDGAVDAFVNSGGVWCNSAGNSRLAHWQGRFADPDNSGHHNFDAGWEINYITDGQGNPLEIRADYTIWAAMVWNEWNATPTDLDFELYYWDGVNNPELVGGSDSEQSGRPNDLPIEEFGFTTTEAGYYGFAIKRYAGANRPEIEFFNRVDTRPLQFNVQNGSITPPADAAGAIAVAALDVNPPYHPRVLQLQGPDQRPRRQHQRR